MHILDEIRVDVLAGEDVCVVILGCKDRFTTGDLAQDGEPPTSFRDQVILRRSPAEERGRCHMQCVGKGLDLGLREIDLARLDLGDARPACIADESGKLVLRQAQAFPLHADIAIKFLHGFLRIGIL